MQAFFKCVIASPLGFFTLTAVGQTQESLLAKLFPHPDGRNALEDYLRAADVVNDGFLDVFLDPTAAVASGQPEQARERERLAASMRSLDYLGRCQEAQKRYGRALDYIASGNLKPVSDPREPWSSTKRYGELGPIRSLARLASAVAYVQQAAGDVHGAVQTMTALIECTRRIGSANGIAFISSYMVTDSALNNLDDMLPVVGLGDAKRISLFAEREITGGIDLTAMVQGYALARDHDFAAGGPDAGLSLADGLPAELLPAASSLTGAERAVFADAYRSTIAGQGKRIAQDLQKPETAWYDTSAAWPGFGDKVATVAPHDPATLAVEVAKSSPISFRRYAIRELTCRARLRLLDLHARVVAFRWRTNRLPATLAELGTDAPIFDALSGKPFAYSVAGDGTYRLFSVGRPETGIVELHSAPAPNAGSGTP